MDFDQDEYKSLFMALQAREEMIIETMKQMFESISQETQVPRVEKMLNEIYDGWQALQQNRQLQKKIQQTLHQPKNVKVLK
ncbi:hypothetical protein C8P63_11128 [Melghirimyces profundicolus]|uniref:Uncharacterized protein n=1 Tax=Melghirimyces profundicolus TaxID=1242148 RepID=A0A2T6BUF2_9BACL|nr:hypothetical protein [Melghirimyces profundicolus]PTX59597.1 hypothetical protein C8P63_11128 [Melghirimyces profundicolus]